MRSRIRSTLGAVAVTTAITGLAVLGTAAAAHADPAGPQPVDATVCADGVALTRGDLEAVPAGPARPAEPVRPGEPFRPAGPAVPGEPVHAAPGGPVTSEPIRVCAPAGELRPTSP
ncbi:hypothetical protein [Pseudonocardia sp. HH130630-07]|uniref:hypothetical protein n=1 Tax=Pseudonocardia sp. HH130630-07 TaxID=1690815 RepID=UPI00081520A9|nr:hypothetical protein [Pseudonocardia sp. HH130630-07]ANY08914.1 hypothetical protein AFB00_24595 [Pseudonocardia sp. HH130630-07]